MHSPLKIGQRILKCLSASAIAFLLCPIVVAQQQSSGPTDNGITAGFSSAYAGGYPTTGIDTVNHYNGRVSLNLPLGNIGARGRVGYTPAVSISRTFLLRTYQTWSYAGNPVRWSDPQYKVISEGYNDSYDYSNFQPGLLPAVIIGRRTRDKNPDPGVIIPSSGYDCTALTKLYLRMAGTEIELRDVGTNGEPHFNSNNSPLNRGRQWHAVDGSGTLFISDADIQDESCVDTGIPAMNGINTVYPTGYLMLEDGTRYRFVDGYPKWMRDRNGNTITFGGSQGGEEVTDSIGRKYRLSSVGSSQGVTYKDHSGTDRTVAIITGNLSSALRSDFAAGGVKTLQSLLPTVVLEQPNALFDPILTKAIRLPNGLEYHFFYTEWGELARIEMPNGGVIEYDYAGGLISGGTQVYRFVTAKRIFDSPGHLQARQTFAYSFPYPGPLATVTTVKTYDASNIVVRNERHTFLGTVFDDFRFMGWYQPFSNGRQLTFEQLNAAGSSVLRRVDNTWETIDLNGAPTSGPPQPRLTHPTNGSVLKPCC